MKRSRNTARDLYLAEVAQPRRDESALDDERSLLDILFRDPTDGMLVVEKVNGTILEANHAVRNHLGFEPTALTGQPLSAVEGRRIGDVPLLEHVHAHGAFTDERELRRVDGSTCVMHVRATPATWRKRPVVIVTLRDVRDRKRAEERRRLAEENYRGIFEHAVEGIFQTTPDGRYLSANPALARMYGYPSSESLVAALTDIAGQLYLDPSRRAEFRRLLDENDFVRGFESEIHRHDGKVIWISENARGVRDERGVLRYYEGTVIDVTERKRAELAQRDEAEVARALADVGLELMASIDSPKILERLCQLSAAALRCEWAHTLLWNVRRDEYVTTSSTTGSRRPAAVSRAALSGVLTALDHEDVIVIDERRSAELPPPLRALQNGSRVGLYSTIRRGGTCVGILMAGYGAVPSEVYKRIARGIAHLASVALEHARALEELEQANRLKSEFLATMTHELRTPLNIILGYNELLGEEQFGPLTTEQKDAVSRIGRNARDLLDMITATLDLTRLDAGALPLDLDRTLLPELLDGIQNDAAEMLRDKPDLALRWKIAVDLPPLQTDRAKLKVVLKNLIHNAVKFTERGHIEVGVAVREGGVEFSVTDTGIGIALDTLPVIFDPFRQGDGSMTRRYGGVGLGLHVVKRLADLLGGKVSVHSRLGEGSTFRVWLPQRDSEAHATR